MSNKKVQMIWHLFQKFYIVLAILSSRGQQQASLLQVHAHLGASNRSERNKKVSCF